MSKIKGSIEDLFHYKWAQENIGKPIGKRIIISYSHVEERVATFKSGTKKVMRDVYVNTRCTCGIESKIKASQLYYNKGTQCRSCSRPPRLKPKVSKPLELRVDYIWIQDNIGKTIGKRKIIGFSHMGLVSKGIRFNRPDDAYLIFADTICECGEEAKIRVSHLKNRKSEACNSCTAMGRRHSEIGKLYPEQHGNKKGSYFNAIIASMRWGAKSRNLVWELEPDDVFKLIQQPCTYCGQVVQFPDTHNGIDRINSELGYTTENTCSCCTTCNFAKGTLSVEAFKNWIKQAYIHQNESK
jgi:hypothetical protein